MGKDVTARMVLYPDEYRDSSWYVGVSKDGNPAFVGAVIACDTQPVLELRMYAGITLTHIGLIHIGGLDLNAVVQALKAPLQTWTMTQNMFAYQQFYITSKHSSGHGETFNKKRALYTLWDEGEGPGMVKVK